MNKLVCTKSHAGSKFSKNIFGASVHVRDCTVVVHLYCSFYLCNVVSAVYATATWLGGWLAGCLSVTRWYCIKTAILKILKLFQPSGSPISLISSDLSAECRYPIPKGTPSAGALNTQEWENWRFSPEITVYLGNGA